VSDSNGPLDGGVSETKGCADGEMCVCEAQAGYSCSGTCRPASDSKSGGLSGAGP
jgi:hypothetical protein